LLDSEASRKIRRGEELTLDYGPLYWRNNPPVEDDDDDAVSEGGLLENAEVSGSDFEMAQRSASDTETLEDIYADDADIDEGT
jgi:SET domain-containing protein